MSDKTRRALEQSELLLAARRPEEAECVVRQALTEDPTSVELNCMLARALLDADRPADAQAAAQTAVQFGPASEHAHRMVALALLAQGSAVAARPFAQQAVALEPNNPNAHFVLARVRTTLHAYNLADGDARRVLELAPTSSLGHHALGLNDLGREDWARAEQHYRDALVLSPNEPSYMNNLGFALLRQGKAAEAAQLFTQAGSTDPRSSRYRTNLRAATRSHLVDTGLTGWLRRRGSAARTALRLALLVSLYVVLAFFVVPVPWKIRVTILAGLGVLLAGRAIVRRRRLQSLPEAAQRLFVQERRAQRSERSKLATGGWPKRTRVFALVVAGLALVALFIPYPRPETSVVPVGPTTTTFGVVAQAECDLAAQGLMQGSDHRVISPAELGCPGAQPDTTVTADPQPCDLARTGRVVGTDGKPLSPEEMGCAP